MRRLLPLLAGVALLGASGASAQATASVRGRVSVGVASVALADAGPIVVYLEAVAAPPPPKTGAGAEIHQHLARFQPAFTVVPVGAEVRMPNDDTIFHNVFSYSKPNDFDLGLYGAGEERTVRFRQPGPVRIYCSIHERMNGLIFVTPSPLFATPAASGEYRIADVPPGRYRLRVWSERLPVWTRDVELRAGETAEVEVRLLALGG
jgi:plastocyanin